MNNIEKENTVPTAKQKKSKKKLSFAKKLLIAVAVYLVILVAGLSVFWMYLDEFESQLPEKYAQSLFEHIKLLKNDVVSENVISYENLSSEIPVSEFENADNYNIYLDSLSDAEFELRPVSAGMGDDKKYAVIANGKKFVDFILHPSQEKTRFGISKWDYGEVTTYVDMKYTVVAEVLPESSLYVNDKKVGDEYIAAESGEYNVYAISGLMTEPKVKVIGRNGYESILENKNDSASEFSSEYKETYYLVKYLNTSSLYAGKTEENDPVIVEEWEDCTYTEHMPNQNDKLFYQTARISGVKSIDDISVYDKSGNAVELVPDENGVYIAAFDYSDELKQEFSDYAHNAALAYAKFMTNDGSINDVARYFNTSSQIYRQIRTSEVYWYTTHSGYSFENESIDEFYVLSDSAFVCRYRGTQTIIRSTGQNRVMELDLTMYFKDNGNGKYQIYDMVVG